MNKRKLFHIMHVINAHVFNYKPLSFEHYNRICDKIEATL